jgi:hypothetical protein
LLGGRSRRERKLEVLSPAVSIRHREIEFEVLPIGRLPHEHFAFTKRLPRSAYDQPLQSAPAFQLPAALCRKVAQADGSGEVEIWGDGEQTRSFLYIDECLEGTTRLLRSNCTDVLNVGSDEMVSINALVQMIANVACKKVRCRHIPGPLGVRGRNSDNRLIAEKLGWRPMEPLVGGIEKTYAWIAAQVEISKQQSGPHPELIPAVPLAQAGPFR